MSITTSTRPASPLITGETETVPTSDHEPEPPGLSNPRGHAGQCEPD